MGQLVVATFEPAHGRASSPGYQQVIKQRILGRDFDA